jgi:steroid delta-isomerase-like uncharacterized protein
VNSKSVVSRYVEAFNAADYETLRTLFAPGAVISGVLGKGTIEAAIPIWRELHQAFAVKLTVEEMIAEGDSVAVRYTERGTFRGPFRGQPPTGKSFELIAMEWFVVRNGKIQQRWGIRDSAAQARQMGLRLS